MDRATLCAQDGITLTLSTASSAGTRVTLRSRRSRDAVTTDALIVSGSCAQGPVVDKYGGAYRVIGLLGYWVIASAMAVTLFFAQ